ncbi:hypothetical protein [Undibacterium sp.]|uniref:hypothetical protein n=1 Tax=Undibacterium sp. TaxID=1914977 RepID=UPI0025D7171D|nr:hypothetical protein [Undibacterium sp.]
MKKNLLLLLTVPALVLAAPTTDYPHNGELNQELVLAIKDMPQAQALSQALFTDKCATCHGTGAGFARTSLSIKDGVLVGKSKGRKVADFLKSHGRLKPDEIQTMVDILTQAISEASAP